MRGKSWLAEKLLASQQGLCSMEIVGKYDTFACKWPMLPYSTFVRSVVNLTKWCITLNHLRKKYFFHIATAPSGPRPPHYRGFKITLRHTTLGRTPLDEWSVRRRDLYLTTLHTHNRQTSMTPAGFEPAVPASERPQTHATGLGNRK
jgi:hypothetical protein